MNIIEAMKYIKLGKKITKPSWFLNGKGLNQYLYADIKVPDKDIYVSTKMHDLIDGKSNLARFYDHDIEDDSWIEWNESMYSKDNDIKDNIWR